MVKFATIIILASLLLFLALPALAQTPPPELAAIDAEVDGWLPRLTLYQNNYAGQNGHNYQMLWSHLSAPSAPSAPNNLLAHPDDQSTTGQDFWVTATMPATPTYRVRIDTYSGPTGAGYVTVLETVVAGESWLRFINNGPELWRESAWFVVSDEF